MVPMIESMHHLVGTAEIAVMLGVSRQRVLQLAQKPGFPKPAVILKGGTVWHTEDIEEWAKARDDKRGKR